MGVFHYFARSKEVVNYRKKQERDERMKAKKNKRQRIQVDAEPRERRVARCAGDDPMAKRACKGDVAEIEAAVDERIKSGAGAVDLMMWCTWERARTGIGPRKRNVRGVRRAANRCGREGSRHGFVQTNGGEAAKLTRMYGTCLVAQIRNACDSQIVRLLFIAHKIFRFQVQFV